MAVDKKALKASDAPVTDSSINLNKVRDENKDELDALYAREAELKGVRRLTNTWERKGKEVPETHRDLALVLAMDCVTKQKMTCAQAADILNDKAAAILADKEMDTEKRRAIAAAYLQVASELSGE